MLCASTVILRIPFRSAGLRADTAEMKISLTRLVPKISNPLSSFTYQTAEVSAVQSHMTKDCEICGTHLPFLIPRISVV
jgi:hypothetical protein